MHASPVVWGVTIAVLVGLLLVDTLIIGRNPHVPSMRECGLAIGFYVILALLFGAGVWHFWGARYAGEYYAGWLTEYSLSIDNLFVFLILMAKLKVPAKLQQFALMVGILLALVFRGVFIAAGAALISAFSWIFFVFGAILIVTATKLVLDSRKEDEGGDATDTFFMRYLRGHLRTAPDFDGNRLTTRVDGKRMLTPMAIVIAALGTTDLMFALDSIPAIYGLTKVPYLVFAANVFALMGLRQLYFLIGGALKKLVYLTYGLALVLAFIGVKLILEALHHYHVVGFEIPTLLSLLVIIGTLAVTTVASLLRSRQLQRADAGVRASLDGEASR